jgi:hypothetical protein
MTSIPSFYFAWVYENETTFDPTTMTVVDEDIFSFDLKHDEGQHPTLDLEIINPRIGLLNPGRKVWAWFARQDPTNGHIVPLFFGVLLGIPTSIFDEKITLKFIARAHTYIEDKQAVAEAMKISPFYDGVFLDDAHRDEPDSVLEGWSALWHIDRTALTTTASDILIGEDGTAVFDVDDAFYKSLSLKIGEAPLTNVRVEATVKWTQRATGFVSMPILNVASYTGDTFMSDWPKGGASLGGGWKAEYTYVADVYHVAETPTVSQSVSQTFYGDVVEFDCSVVSSSQSFSYAALQSPNPLSGLLTYFGRGGLCDPYSDPPDNRPSTYSLAGQTVPLWNLACDMTLRYDAKRAFSELLAFDVIADTQSVLASPTVAQHSELISISGTDVGEPLQQIDAWSDFAGKYVGLGQIIFPNDPTTPGGLAHQVCVQAGTAGGIEPTFSDVPGTVVVDGSVHWSSMGLSPLTHAPDWAEASFVPRGEIICYQKVTFDLNTGNFDPTGETTYYLCTTPGETNAVNEQYSYVPEIKTSDEGTPAPIIIDHIFAPTFTTTYGATVSDGSVVWTCLGVSPAILQIPAGGTPGNVPARCYFPTQRGQNSVEYLISKARARLRKRSRAVTVGWDCPFDLATSLSCRMNATINDSRLPGGTATGKIISYSLSSRGGKEIGHIEIGCAVGLEGGIVTNPGVGVYASSGYMQSNYQQMDGEIIGFPTSDVTYTPPRFYPFDDGISFPITDLSSVSEPHPDGNGGRAYGEFNMSAGVPSTRGYGTFDPTTGNYSAGLMNATGQAAIIEASFPVASYLAEINFQVPPAQQQETGDGGAITTVTGFSAARDWYNVQQALFYTARSTPYVMEANPVSWNIFFKPVVGGTFEGSYAPIVSRLVINKGIDLAAESSL